jgi:PTH1 family peptidyl-tRNA hydrolase
MLLFAGLGNPGAGHAKNRHNIGFMTIEAVHRTHHFAPFRSRFHGLVAEGTIAGHRVVLLKPSTFMNESGRAVGAAARYYKLSLPDILVAHDELDLAPAKLRIKRGGGNAGHNGLRSITAHLGNDYKRLRIGIGHPGDKALVHTYVLSDFSKAERPLFEGLCDTIAAQAEFLVAGADATFQNKVHLALKAKGLANPE